MSTIPIIDLRQLTSSSVAQSERQRQLQELLLGCEDHGFFLLRGHGHEALVEEVFAQARALFALPRQQKLQLQRDQVNPFGYYDRELTKRKRDRKEVFDFRAGGYQSKDPAKQQRWPASLLDFEPVMTRFFAAFTDLSNQTMGLIFSSLGMSDAAIAQVLERGFGARHSSTARLNFYPEADPVPVAERTGVAALGDMALHHHTDPGAITLLLQDEHGGLQANSRMHGWVDVPPLPGSIVVNVGDVMQVWTNDRCVAGEHRVLPVHKPSGRLSVPFFLQPAMDAVIEPWTGDGQAARYHSFSWREFINGRVADNYADLGAADIQIDRYRVA